MQIYYMVDLNQTRYFAAFPTVPCAGGAVGKDKTGDEISQSCAVPGSAHAPHPVDMGANKHRVLKISGFPSTHVVHTYIK